MSVLMKYTPCLSCPASTAHVSRLFRVLAPARRMNSSSRCELMCTAISPSCFSARPGRGSATSAGRGGAPWECWCPAGTTAPGLAWLHVWCPGGSGPTVSGVSASVFTSISCGPRLGAYCGPGTGTATWRDAGIATCAPGAGIATWGCTGIATCSGAGIATWGCGGADGRASSGAGAGAGACSCLFWKASGGGACAGVASKSGYRGPGGGAGGRAGFPVSPCLPAGGGGGGGRSECRCSAPSLALKSNSGLGRYCGTTGAGRGGARYSGATLPPPSPSFPRYKSSRSAAVTPGSFSACCESSPTLSSANWALARACAARAEASSLLRAS
mmetsp:Transcript_58516/g.186462  ORF Transcript_58516/g.186462 Transcript_58516/m.186462 type:complete len:329 (-) Transcript_58516:510-1496(-)